MALGPSLQATDVDVGTTVRKDSASPAAAPKNVRKRQTKVAPPAAQPKLQPTEGEASVAAKQGKTLPKLPKPKAGKDAVQRSQKIKMVRDGFTFPEAEHKRLVEMKKRLIELGTEVKKGELVRAGLVMLASLDNEQLMKAVSGVQKLKTGRPKK